jgi:hypothetical protein
MEFQNAVESHRHELMVHCYRMVGVGGARKLDSFGGEK